MLTATSDLHDINDRALLIAHRVISLRIADRTYRDPRADTRDIAMTERIEAELYARRASSRRATNDH